MDSSTTNCLVCNDEIVKVEGNFVKLTRYSFQDLTSLLQLPPLPQGVGGLGRGAVRNGHILLCPPCGQQVQKFKDKLIRLRQLQKDVNDIQESVTQAIIRNSNESVQTDPHVRTARNIICYNLTATREATLLGVPWTAPKQPESNTNHGITDDEDEDPSEDPLAATQKPPNFVQTRKCSIVLVKLDLFKRSKPTLSNKNKASYSSELKDGKPSTRKRKKEVRNPLRWYHCSQCGILCKDRRGFRKHQILHSRIYTCSICDKAFGSKGVLGHHMKWHDGKERYRCLFPNCPSSFIYQSDFDRHVKTHTGDKPFPCSQCESTFARNSTLNRHVREVHSRAKRYACGECNQSFLSKADMIAHENVKDTEKSVRIECTWCNKLFTRWSCLREHESIIHHKVIHRSGTVVEVQAEKIGTVELS